MQSAFTSQTLAEIFRDLYLGERSGTLVLEGETGNAKIFFDRGLLTFACSDMEGGDLGRRLLATQQISPGALDEAGKIRIEIIDSRGIVVSVLQAYCTGPGTEKIPWELKDESGSSLAPGIYMFRVVSGLQLYSGRFIHY